MTEITLMIRRLFFQFHFLYDLKTFSRYCEQVDLLLSKHFDSHYFDNNVRQNIDYLKSNLIGDNLKNWLTGLLTFN